METYPKWKGHLLSWPTGLVIGLIVGAAIGIWCTSQPFMSFLYGSTPPVDGRFVDDGGFGDVAGGIAIFLFLGFIGGSIGAIVGALTFRFVDTRMRRGYLRTLSGV